MIVIAGPTASGKTDLAAALARRLGGEIVSADSRQVYRGLDAGTAKPKLDAQGKLGGVLCHLVDCAEPAERFDAGRFVALARPRCAEISSRGLVPIVAGGTGLYLRALLEGLSSLPPADLALRARLEADAARDGRPGLHRRLAQVDPEAAASIPANNIQRVVRALEVYELTGRPISSHWKDAPAQPGLTAAALVIEWPADELRRRIEERSRALWPGLLVEVERLCVRPGAPYTGQEPGFQSLGYAEALLVLRGLSDDEGLQRLIRSTLAYAKRQRTWFRGQLKAKTVEGTSLERMVEQALSLLEAHETAAA